FCCPYHDETHPSGGITKEYPYVYNCFGCGSTANITQLVAYALGYKSLLVAEHYITRNYLTISVKDRKPLDIESLLDDRGQSRKVSIHEDDVTKFLQKRHSYMYRRGFCDKTLDKYEIGYDEQQDAITFPVRTSKGDVRFIKRRFVQQKGFMNQSGIDKKDIVYGLYYIKQAQKPIHTIFLNESETDTMACYESGMAAGAILGRILFKQQVKELLKSGIKTVNLFFDNDRHGVECTIKSYFLLTELTPIKVNVVIYPEGHYAIDCTGETVYKDANDLLKANRMQDIQVIPVEQFMAMLNYRNLLDIDW
ncbi:toprim domain-containing protein, partial [Solibacillus silvestris]